MNSVGMMISKAKGLRLFFHRARYAFILYLLQITIVGFNEPLQLDSLFNSLVVFFPSFLVVLAGFIINDYFDVKADYSIRPSYIIIGRLVSRRKAILVHTLLSVSSLVLALYIKAGLVIILFSLITIFWLYSAFLKRQPLIGNIFSGLIMFLLLLQPFAYLGLWKEYTLYILFFAFFWGFVRDFIKDLICYREEKQNSFKTTVVNLGIRKSKQFLCRIVLCYIGLNIVAGLVYSSFRLNVLIITLALALAYWLLRFSKVDTRKGFKDSFYLMDAMGVSYVLGMQGISLL